ncbi:MAG: glycerol-3-phosphate acyltransferase, partial [Tabrizicola sp.]
AAGTRRFRNRPFVVALHAMRFLVARWRGKTKGFGTAAAGFGAPVSLAGFLAEAHEKPVEELGERLMAAIAAVVPVLPVPLVAAALGTGVASREALVARVEALADRLRAAGAVLKLPPQGIGQAVDEGLAPLLQRGLVSADLQPVQGQEALLAFYAAAIPGDAATRQT